MEVTVQVHLLFFCKHGREGNVKERKLPFKHEMD